MISVIIPVYNVRPFLNEAVDSVIGQTYQDLEIILVDDGSTDGSGLECDKYREKDDRIIVIHQEHKGLSAARNTGLDICRGDIISFLDADDAFSNNMLEKMHAALEKSGADIAECNFVKYRSIHRMDPRKISNKIKCITPGDDRTNHYTAHEALKMTVNKKMSPSVWNKLYRRSVWESLRFREGCNYEDIDIILPLISRASSIFILDAPLVMHRKRPGSITTTHSADNITDLVRAYDNFLAYVVAHIPDTFDDNDRIIVSSRLLSSLLNHFFIVASSGQPGRKDLLNLLRSLIASAEQRLDINERGLKLRASSYLYHYANPVLAGLVYRFYRLVRFATLRVASL